MGVHATQPGYLAALSDADAGAAGVRARPTSRCPSPPSAQVIGQVQPQRHGSARHATRACGSGAFDTPCDAYQYAAREYVVPRKLQPLKLK